MVMLKEKMFWWSIGGFFAVSILGTVNHFLYSLSGNNMALGLIVPINESVWEHLKLLFFPYLVWFILEFFIYGKNIYNFIFIRFIGVLCGMVFITAAYYIFRSVLGKSIIAVDITLFFIGVFVSYSVGGGLYRKNQSCIVNKNVRGAVLFSAVTMLFFIFTFIRPDIPLFYCGG